MKKAFSLTLALALSLALMIPAMAVGTTETVDMGEYLTMQVDNVVEKLTTKYPGASYYGTEIVPEGDITFNVLVVSDNGYTMTFEAKPGYELLDPDKEEGRDKVAGLERTAFQWVEEQGCFAYAYEAIELWCPSVEERSVTVGAYVPGEDDLQYSVYWGVKDGNTYWGAEDALTLIVYESEFARLASASAAEPAAPAEPEQPTEPAAPAEPEQPTEPAAPAETEQPAAPAAVKMVVDTRSDLKLNVRTGPGTNYKIAAPSLKNGTEVQVVETQGEWAKLADDAGWVYLPALKAAATPAQPAASEEAAAPAGPELAEGETAYTIKSGDTLSKIAKTVYGDASAYKLIAERNQDIIKDVNKIYAGQIIVLPVKE